MSELSEKLERNARFYASEAVALGEDQKRRDRRHLGAKEAATIAELLREAAEALKVPA
jgi:hypothetical protein